MSKKPMPYHLTPSERSIMDILWNAKSSMSQASIVEKAKDADTMTWKERSIFSMVNSLLAKGIIEEDSFIRSGKNLRSYLQTHHKPCRVLRSPCIRRFDRERTP